MTDPRYPGWEAHEWDGTDYEFLNDYKPVCPERSPMALVYALIAFVAFGFGVIVGMAVMRNI